MTNLKKIEKYRDFVLNKGVLPIKIEIAELIIKIQI